MNTMYTWSTTKTDSGFAFKVYQVVSRATPNAVGQYADTTLMHSAQAHSRAVAKAHAQKWVRYFRALQKQAA